MENVLSITTQRLPCLYLSDTGNQALLWMQEFRVNHLPVLEGDKWIGTISEDFLLENDTEKKLSDYTLKLNNAFVYEDQHVLEAIRLLEQHQLTCLPVLSKTGGYLGCVTRDDVISYIYRALSLSEMGGIVMLKVPFSQYDLGQIARIVESNNARILALFCTPKDGYYEVTLRINREDLSHIIATFERFNYEVLNAYYQATEWEDLEENYEQFIKYLNI
ncbi:MAG: CBS domain-containing protein [Bacteroidia bacterium]|nr:CBS domain-containing protein [Bacteroidia bacterium]MDW8302255.1 CBS domain-containing protein [Bacteroidia bacterium]